MIIKNKRMMQIFPNRALGFQPNEGHKCSERDYNITKNLQNKEPEILHTKIKTPIDGQGQDTPAKLRTMGRTEHGYNTTVTGMETYR